MKSFNLGDHLLLILLQISSPDTYSDYADFFYDDVNLVPSTISDLCAFFEFYNLKRKNRKALREYKDFQKSLKHGQNTEKGKVVLNKINTSIKIVKQSLIDGMKYKSMSLNSDLHILLFIIKNRSLLISTPFRSLLEGGSEPLAIISFFGKRAISLKVLLNFVEHSLIPELLLKVKKDVLEDVFCMAYTSLHVLNYNTIELQTENTYQELEMQAIRILLALDIEVPDID